MSNNVPKLSKQQSQPAVLTSTNLIQPNSSLQLQHHPSLDGVKDRESAQSIKDIQPHTTSSQAGIKKLAFFLDPHKSLHTSVSPAHGSPKSFIASSTKNSKLKVSTSSLETSNLNLISPKDLVRLAMSKHKPKASLKKVTVQSSTAIPKNMRKSLSLRFAPGMARPEKREGSTSKLTSTSIVEDNSAISKTSIQLPQDKSAKLKRMKLIYNDTSQTDITKLAKSTVYTPQETSGRMWQGTLSPNRSNSGLLWPGSPNGIVNKNQLYVNPVGFGNSDKAFLTKNTEEDTKEEKSYRKRGSVEHIGSYLKEFKPLAKQGKRGDKKTAQPRAMTSMDNPKMSSTSFSRLMSHTTINHTINHDGIERMKSVDGLKGVDNEEMNETLGIFEAVGETHGANMKEVKPREEFIADLKNWVNDIVKPQEENPILHNQLKNPAAAEKVKEAQEGMLEKLRGALENDEFVRREDYERLYREKDNIEDELDAVKEENAQLRALLWRIQEENEARELREAEERKITEHDLLMSPQIQELVREVDMLRRRESVVKDLLKMVQKAGVQINELQDDEMLKENLEYEQQYEQEHYVNQHYIDNSSSYQSASSKQGQLKQKYENENYMKNQLHPIGENIYKEENGLEEESYGYTNNEVIEQNEEYEESETSSQHVVALSEMSDSIPPSSNRQQLEMMSTGSPTALVSTVLKSTSNPKSTADSSPKFSAKLGTPQSCFPSKTQGNMKIDLTGLGGNQKVSKMNVMPDHSSMEKINNYMMTADGAQALGFHEEFMSKLEEFSLSWRQDALNYQKF